METTAIEGDTMSLAVILLNIPISVYPILLASLVLLAMSALISASEVAFFSLSPAQLERCRQSDRAADSQILLLIGEPRRLLATILIMNNLVNVGIVTLLTFVTWEVYGKDNQVAMLMLSVVATTAIVFFGEIVPKVYATQRNMAIARFSATWMALAMALLHPFSWMLTFFGGLLEKNLKRKGYTVSANELNEAVEMAAGEESTADQREILKGIVNFSTKSAKQVMRSRIDITAFDMEMDYHELMDKINKSGYSRVPIYSETIDRIKGILYIKDLLPHIDQDEKFRWQQLVRRDTFFVPEGKKIDELLSDFQEKRVHMAIVVDEYGGTSGLVTMEDIIEEIIGEINDEFDNDSLGYKRIDEATFTFEAKTSLNDFCKVVGAEADTFATAKGESESLAGLMLELFAKMPAAGEQVDFDNFVFTVVSVNNKRIKSVRVLIKDRVKNLINTEFKN